MFKSNCRQDSILDHDLNLIESRFDFVHHCTEAEIDKNGKKSRRTRSALSEIERNVKVMVKWLVYGIRMITDCNKSFSC